MCAEAWCFAREGWGEAGLVALGAAMILGQGRPNVIQIVGAAMVAEEEEEVVDVERGFRCLYATCPIETPPRMTCAGLSRDMGVSSNKSR